MKKWHYIFCIILFHLGLPCGYAANDGTCATRGGTHTLSLNFPLTTGNDSNLLIVFYVQIMPDDFVMQLHRF